MSITNERELAAASKKQTKERQIKLARKLTAEGYTNVAIANMMGLSESTVRNLLKGS
jgi:DNA-binding NarL/FixJ family response regulator